MGRIPTCTWFFFNSPRLTHFGDVAIPVAMATCARLPAALGILPSRELAVGHSTHSSAPQHPDHSLAPTAPRPQPGTHSTQTAAGHPQLSITAPRPQLGTHSLAAQLSTTAPTPQPGTHSAHTTAWAEPKCSPTRCSHLTMTGHQSRDHQPSDHQSRGVPLERGVPAAPHGDPGRTDPAQEPNSGSVVPVPAWRPSEPSAGWKSPWFTQTPQTQTTGGETLTASCSVAHEVFFSGHSVFRGVLLRSQCLGSPAQPAPGAVFSLAHEHVRTQPRRVPALLLLTKLALTSRT